MLEGSPYSPRGQSEALTAAAAAAAAASVPEFGQGHPRARRHPAAGRHHLPPADPDSGSPQHRCDRKTGGVHRCAEYAGVLIVQGVQTKACTTYRVCDLRMVSAAGRQRRDKRGQRHGGAAEGRERERTWLCSTLEYSGACTQLHSPVRPCTQLHSPVRPCRAHRAAARRPGAARRLAPRPPACCEVIRATMSMIVCICCMDWLPCLWHAVCWGNRTQVGAIGQPY